MKRPAFQFYPADWTKDLGLRSCSLGARGLWMEMLCMAHESERYGFLVLNGAPLTDVQIANTVAGSTRKMITELETAGVFSRDESGAIFSRRMVRDEKLREVRAACGQLGGNPNLLGKKVKQKQSKPPTEVDDKVNQFPTPSSSSSSSSKSDVGVTPTDTARPQATETGKIAVGSTAKVNGAGQNWSNPAWVAATATTLGIPRRQGEGDDDFKDRIYAAVQGKRAAAAQQRASA